MSHTDQSLVNALKRHTTLLVAIATVIWLVIHCFSMMWLFSRLDSVRCVCRAIRIEANGNTSTVHVKTQADLVEAVLRKRGEIE